MYIKFKSNCEVMFDQSKKLAVFVAFVVKLSDLIKFDQIRGT